MTLDIPKTVVRSQLLGLLYRRWTDRDTTKGVDLRQGRIAGVFARRVRVRVRGRLTADERTKQPLGGSALSLARKTTIKINSGMRET